MQDPPKKIHVANRPNLNYVVLNMLAQLQKIWKCSTSEAARRLLNPLVPQINEAIMNDDPVVDIKLKIHLDPNYWEYRTHNMAVDWNTD